MLRNLGFVVYVAVFYGFDVVHALNCCPPKPDPSPEIIANLTCDQTLQVFVDGQPVGPESQSYVKVDQYSIPPDSRVLALKCHSGAKLSLVTGGILGSLSNGMVTNSSWLCSNSAQQGWTAASFDDSLWTSAHEHATNSRDVMQAFPWKFIQNVANGSKWIWTKDNMVNDSTVYCRLKLSNETLDRCIKERKADLYRGEASFIDHSLNGSVVMAITTASSTECALRCHRVPRCASFNFEYGGRESQKICELNSRCVGSSDGLVERQGFVYFDAVFREN